MQSYLDDPREFPSRYEYPTTIGGAAEMYQWQATLCDLSDMSEAEYMKPMTVIVGGVVSGLGDTYALRYYIDNVIKMEVYLASGDTIPAYTGSTEKMGYTFNGWADATGTLYSGTTMPASNLNLYASYTRINEVLQYGPVLNGIITSAVVLTSAYTSEFGTAKVTTFFVPLDAFYLSASTDETWVREHEAEYRASHKYPALILMPQNISGAYTIVASEGVIPVTFAKDGTATYNGKVYDKYKYETENMCASVVDQTWTFTITLVEK